MLYGLANITNEFIVTVGDTHDIALTYYFDIYNFRSRQVTRLNCSFSFISQRYQKISVTLPLLDSMEYEYRIIADDGIKEEVVERGILKII